MHKNITNDHLILSKPIPIPSRIAAINSLRGLAILAVLYEHFVGPMTPPGWHAISIGGLPLFPATYLSNGWMGVNLFFVLSGFVLYLPYATGKRSIDEPGAIIGYYKQRALRLLPLYAISTIILDMLVNKPNYASTITWKYYAIMATVVFPFFRTTFSPRMNFVLWTLGIELWFSAIFPLLMIAINRFSLRCVLLTVLAVSLGMRLVGTTTRFLVAGFMLNYVKDSIISRLDDFLIGMAACATFVRGDPSIVRRPAAWIVAGTASLTIGCWAWDYTRLEQLPAWPQAFWNLFISGGFYLILLGILNVGPGFLRSAVTTPALQIPGLMCYSIYIWHYPLYLIAFPNGWMLHDSPQFFGFLTVLFFFCTLSYRYIEFGSERDVRKLFKIES